MSASPGPAAASGCRCRARAWDCRRCRSTSTSCSGRTTSAAIVRVGSCGALSEDLRLRDLVIASGACTDSSMNRIRFEGLDYAPVADFGLLRAAHDAAEAARLDVAAQVGLILSSDSFYSPRPS